MKPIPRLRVVPILSTVGWPRQCQVHGLDLCAGPPPTGPAIPPMGGLPHGPIPPSCLAPASSQQLAAAIPYACEPTILRRKIQGSDLKMSARSPDAAGVRCRSGRGKRDFPPIGNRQGGIMQLAGYNPLIALFPCPHYNRPLHLAGAYLCSNRDCSFLIHHRQAGERLGRGAASKKNGD